MGYGDEVPDTVLDHNHTEPSVYRPNDKFRALSVNNSGSLFKAAVSDDRGSILKCCSIY